MKIVVDSGCDFTENMENNKGISIDRAPLTLQLDDKQFIDDGTLDIEQYLNEMARAKETPKTAAPSPESFLEKYKGEASVFVVTLSSFLSASYNNAVLAKQMYLEEIGSKFIHVFDSLSASVGETVIAMKINEYIKQKLHENEIVDKVNSFMKNMRTYFILDNYTNLVKSGRISPYVAKIGQFLSIKPICCGQDGKIAFLDKARGFHKAIDRLVNIIEKESVDFENRILGISHANCPEKAQFFKELILKRLTFKDVIIVDVSGLCATYADRGGLIISF